MTKLYFHSATSTVTGTLPTAEQSALTAIKNADAQTVNRAMDNTIGVAQTSIVLTSNATVSAQDYYITKFVSPILAVTSISANTWNYSLACQESSTQANFPRSGLGALYVNCYVWNTNTGAIVGTILDGATSGTTFSEPSLGAEKSEFGTFAGSAVASIPAGCVIVFEVWARVTQGSATAFTDTFFYDGNVETSTDGNTVSNHASYIETPQTLTFGGGAVTIPQTIYIEWEEA